MLKERNEELLSYYIKNDDSNKINLHFVIKSILATKRPFAKLDADVSMNILKDLNFADSVAFEMYKTLLLN